MGAEILLWQEQVKDRIIKEADPIAIMTIVCYF